MVTTMAKSNQKFIKWPPPGSLEAQKVGCICPVEDNKYGAGVVSANGDGANYWINLDCKIHKKLTSEE